MTAGAIAPLSPVEAVCQAHAATPAAHAQPATGVSNHPNPAVESLKLAQQQQMFAQLMQATSASVMSPSMKSPKDDEDD